MFGSNRKTRIELDQNRSITEQTREGQIGPEQNWAKPVLARPVQYEQTGSVMVRPVSVISSVYRN